MEKLKPKIDIYAGHGRELKMEEQKLCRKCQEELKKEYPFGHPIYGCVHCHHPEPEPEKPPCEWCDEWGGLWVDYLGTYIFKTIRRMVTKCPECGATL